MAGSMGDVSVADAIIKGIKGFDVQTAYQAILKDAKEIPPSGVTGIGRGCLEAYEVNVYQYNMSVRPF
jgi:putative alpha-1,2-mannosidase